MWLLLASSPGPLPPVHLPASVCALRLPNRCPHPEGPSATHILSIDGMKWRSPPGPASSGGLEGILSHLSWPLVAAAVPWFLGLWPHRPHLGLHGHLASLPLCVSPSASFLHGDTRQLSGLTCMIQGHRPISRPWTPQKGTFVGSRDQNLPAPGAVPQPAALSRLAQGPRRLRAPRTAQPGHVRTDSS